MAQKDALAAHNKCKQALTLALAGVDYQTIADKVGYKSRQAAWVAVKSAIQRTIRPMAEEVKQMQLDRLDFMLRSIWKDVAAGHLGAIDRALKIEERRAKLLGIDAPQKTDLTSGGEPIKAYIGWTPDEWDHQQPSPQKTPTDFHA